MAWQKSEAVQQVWRAVVALLAYPHLWVRKAAGRLVGLLLSTAKLGTAQILTLSHHSCITVNHLHPCLLLDELGYCRLHVQ